MSNLTEHAKRELALVGNGPEFDEKILEMIETFSQMGHSGGSAFYTIAILENLLRYKNLSRLTNDRDEWYEVGMDSKGKSWQNARRADAFTYDPNKQFYYTLDDHGALSREEFDNRKYTQTDKRKNSPRQFKNNEIALFETKNVTDGEHE